MSLNLEQEKLIEDFESSLDRTSLQQSTVKQYIWCMNHYMKHNFDLSSIEDYNSVLVDHSIKKRSNIFYSAFKRFIKFYIEDISQRNRMVKALIFPTINNPFRHRKFLDFNERKRIIANIEKEKHKLMAKIQFFTGCRAREILKLEKGDIYYDDFNGHCVMILNITQKGGQKSPIWILDKDLEEDIDAYTLSDWVDWKYYFVNRQESHKNTVNNAVLLQTNYVWYWRDLKKAVEKCGYAFKDYATHDFRRGVASDVWYATKDPLSVQRTLRHKDFSTTARYLSQTGLQTQDLFAHLQKVYSRK